MWNKKPCGVLRTLDGCDNGPTLKSYAMAKFGEVELGAVVSHRGRVHLSESLESNFFTDTTSQTCTDAIEEKPQN